MDKINFNERLAIQHTKHNNDFSLVQNQEESYQDYTIVLKLLIFI